MALFRKKEKDLELPTLEEMESMQSQQQQTFAAPAAVQDASNVNIAARLERIEAQLQAGSEIRRLNDERYAMINESLGEIRNSLMEKEKMIKNIEIMSTKAHDLVETVQPQSLMEQVMRLDSRINSSLSKIESNTAFMENIVNEIKDIRRNIELFRGVEQIIKISKDVKEDINTIRKIQVKTEGEADKVAGIFADVEAKFEKFADLNNRVKDIQSAVESITKDFVELKSKSSDFVTIDLVEDLKGSTHDLVAIAMERLNEISSTIADIKAEIMAVPSPQIGQMPSLVIGKQQNYRKTEYYFVLEKIMSQIGEMMKEKASDDEIKMFLAEMKIDANVVESIIYEARSYDNKLMKLASYAKRRAGKNISAAQIKSEIMGAGWAENIAELATREI